MDAGCYPRLENVWLTEDLNISFPREGQAIRYAVRIAVDRYFPETRLVQGSRQRLTVRGSGNCGDKRMSRNAVEQRA